MSERETKSIAYWTDHYSFVLNGLRQQRDSIQHTIDVLESLRRCADDNAVAGEHPKPEGNG